MLGTGRFFYLAALVAKVVCAQSTVDDFDIVCSASVSVATPGEALTVRAFVPDDLANSVSYVWSVTAGTISGSGPTINWKVANATSRNSETVFVAVRAESGRRGVCAFQLMMLNREDVRAPETGIGLLKSGEKEAAGFGLYSYLLLAAKPRDNDRARYLQVLESALLLVPQLSALRHYFPQPQHLNSLYIPVVSAPPTNYSKLQSRKKAEWLLDSYDYARARAILARVPGSTRNGPYLVSFSNLDSATPAIVQDLSLATTELADIWVREFITIAGQEHSWTVQTVRNVALRVRTVLAIAGKDLPNAKSAAKDWIQFGSQASDETKK
jgi:hypothetical protein